MKRKNGWDLSTHHFGLSACLPAGLHPFLIYYLTATCKTDNHPLPLTQSTSRDFNSSQLLFFLPILKLQPSFLPSSTIQLQIQLSTRDIGSLPFSPLNSLCFWVSRSWVLSLSYHLSQLVSPSRRSPSLNLSLFLFHRERENK